MDRLEQQMRDLTGRVEDETNQVQQLRQRLEQVNSDLEVRLGQGQGQDAAAPPPFAQPAALAPSYGRPPPPSYGRPTPPGYGALTPPGEPPAPLTGSGAPPYSGPGQLTPSQIARAGDT